MDSGKNFEGEVRGSLKSIDCFWFRIQDTNDISRFVKHAIAVKQPGDFMAVYRRKAFLLECKTSKGKKSFPLYYGETPSIPNHQIEAGIDIKRHGGLSYFLLRRDEQRKKRMWAITPEGILRLYLVAKKKSIPWTEIDASPHSIEIKRLTAPVRWDLEKLFKLRQPL